MIFTANSRANQTSIDYSVRSTVLNWSKGNLERGKSLPWTKPIDPLEPSWKGLHLLACIVDKLSRAAEPTTEATRHSAQPSSLNRGTYLRLPGSLYQPVSKPTHKTSVSEQDLYSIDFTTTRKWPLPNKTSLRTHINRHHQQHPSGIPRAFKPTVS